MYSKRRTNAHVLFDVCLYHWGEWDRETIVVRGTIGDEPYVRWSPSRWEREEVLCRFEWRSRGTHRNVAQKWSWNFHRFSETKKENCKTFKYLKFFICKAKKNLQCSSMLFISFSNLYFIFFIIFDHRL